MDNYETRLATFLAGLAKIEQENKDKHFPNSPIETFEVMAGQKYDRIVKNTGSQRRAHCFIERATGNVLKCDGWKRPRPHASIFGPDNGLSVMGPYGVRYL